MRNQNLEKLRADAAEIQPIVSSSVCPAVQQRIAAHRADVLSSTDSQQIREYLECATDAECLCALSQMALTAPLNDTFYNIFAYLAAKEMSAAGMELPEEFDDVEPELPQAEQRELEEFRRGLRRTQQRARANGAFQ